MLQLQKALNRIDGFTHLLILHIQIFDLISTQICRRRVVDYNGLCIRFVISSYCWLHLPSPKRDKRREKRGFSFLSGTNAKLGEDVQWHALVDYYEELIIVSQLISCSENDLITTDSLSLTSSSWVMWLAELSSSELVTFLGFCHPDALGKLTGLIWTRTLTHFVWL